MEKGFSVRLICFLLTIFLCVSNLYAADLLQVYRDALCFDPLYQEAISQQLSNAQGVPINLASLLPNISGSFLPYISKTQASGSAVSFTTLPDGTSSSGSNTTRGYSWGLSLNQAVFDFVKIHQFAAAIEIAKQAQALINAALQDLAVRVSRAYFAVVADQENLKSALKITAGYKKQLARAMEQQKAGYKSIIDVHSARASYEKSKAKVLALQITLAADQEKLHVITQHYYPKLAKLRSNPPLITPHPNYVEQWLRVAMFQNWTIKAAQYAKESAVSHIKQQFSGHLPTVYLQSAYDVSFNRTIGDPSSPSTGTSRFATRSANLNIILPIYSGGGVTAQTQQAIYDYQVASAKLSRGVLDTVELTKNSFYGVITRIDKIRTDAAVVLATRKSLDGLEASYLLGTESIINVLNQRENLFQAEVEYTNDIYLYLINFLSLKQAAGTLCSNDLVMINSWLDHTANC